MKFIIKEIVENVHSGIKACFKSIVNYEHPFERKKMFNLKRSSKLNATLLAFMMGVAVFMAGSAASAEQLIRDQRTGEMIRPPQYGGTITFPFLFDPGSFDAHTSGYKATRGAGIMLEKLFIADWTQYDPNGQDFSLGDLDFEYTTPWLAESWERPDRLTYVIKIRKGIHYHEPDTPGGKLVGGREMNAKDVAYSFQRMLGIGKFEGKDPNPNVPEWKGTVVKSITATDDWTVEFKFIKNMPTFLTQVWRPWHGTQINPPEILEQWGNFVSWEHVVGTGPYMIKEYASGSHITYAKNPNYWAMDPVFPGYKLPYADEIKGIIIEDAGTRLAAFRTGQVDWIREIPSKDAPAIIKKNPEVKYLNVLGAPGMHLAMNQKGPSL